MIAAAALLVQSRTLAAVTVEILERQDRVAAVLYAQTQFRARLTVGGEDHTAEATFSWIFYGGEPAEADENPVLVGFEDPGTHLVQVTGHYQGEQGITIESIRAIGGAPTVDEYGNFLFWHAPYNQPTYKFHGRPEQPTGTQYEWAFNSGEDKVEVIGGLANLDLEVKPIHSSDVVCDVFPELCYTLASTTVGYESMATVHKPTVPYSRRDLANSRFSTQEGPPEWEQKREVDYHCKSQFGLVMEGMWWVESTVHFPDSPYQGEVEQGPAKVPANGIITDELVFYKGTEWSGEPWLLMHDCQYIWLGGWHGQDTTSNAFWINEVIHTDVPATTVNALDGHG